MACRRVQSVRNAEFLDRVRRFAAELYGISRGKWIDKNDNRNTAFSDGQNANAHGGPSDPTFYRWL